jgi:hypothetical protein
MMASQTNIMLMGQLQARVPEVGLQFVSLQRALSQLVDRYLLEPPELFQRKFLLEQLRVMRAHVDALQKELAWLAAGRVGNPFLGALIVRDLPGPISGFKGRAMDDSFVVEVVSGVLLDVRTGPEVVFLLLFLFGFFG